MIGHNWGAEHAERWVWIQANELRGGDGYFDAAVGRIKVGPLMTPWVGNAMLRLDGSRASARRLRPDPLDADRRSSRPSASSSSPAAG